MPTSLAGASSPEAAASGTAGLSRITTSGAFPALTAVVRLFSRSLVAAEVRVIVVPVGAQAFRYFAQSESSLFWGYGSQTLMVLMVAPPAAALADVAGADAPVVAAGGAAAEVAAAAVVAPPLVAGLAGVELPEEQAVLSRATAIPAVVILVHCCLLLIVR